MRLSAYELCTKFGFSDGDIVGDYCDENKIDLKKRYHKDVLVKLVRKYLEPKLTPGISLYEICSIHNPIRCDDECWDKCNECNVIVDITREQILETIEEVEPDDE